MILHHFHSAYPVTNGSYPFLVFTSAAAAAESQSLSFLEHACVLEHAGWRCRLWYGLPFSASCIHLPLSPHTKFRNYHGDPMHGQHKVHLFVVPLSISLFFLLFTWHRATWKVAHAQLTHARAFPGIDILIVREIVRFLAVPVVREW